MSEMNLVSIELKQPSEFKGVSDELASTVSSPKKRFSDVIDEHYNKVLDKKAEGSDTVDGKKTHDKANNDRDIDGKAPKLTGEPKSQADIDELKKHLAALDPKSTSIAEDSSLKERAVKAPKNEHTLPVPLPSESDDIDASVPKTSISGSEEELVKRTNKAPKDEHTLPVPPPVKVVSQDEEQASNKAEKVDKSAIDLLAMLGKADRILSSTDKKVTETVHVDLADKPQNGMTLQKEQQEIASEAGEEATQSTILNNQKNEERAVKTSLATEDSSLNKIEKYDTELPQKKANVQGEPQSIKVDNQSILASNKPPQVTVVNKDLQHTVVEPRKVQQGDSELSSHIGDLDVNEEERKVEMQSSREGEQPTGRDKTQGNVQPTKDNVDPSANVIIQQNSAMKANLNQTTDEVIDKPQSVQPSIIASQTNQVKANGKSVNEPTHLDSKSIKVDDIVENEFSENVSSEEVVSNKSDKALSEKAALTTALNQSVAVNVPRSILGELDAQSGYEENFDHTINQLTNTTVQSQKSITALQTETISIYRKDFADQVKDKVMVMINQKIQQVDIQLDPPEMGNVHVRVNLQNEQAAVQFVVQNQQAKDALEQNMGRLRDMLAENGVDVGDANIEQRDSGQQDNMASSGEGRASDGSEADELERVNSDAQVAHLVKGSSTGVDYYA